MRKNPHNRIIPLPSQQFLQDRLDYNPKTGTFIWKYRNISRWDLRWAGRIATVVTKNGYQRIGFNKRYYLAHRLAWMYAYGEDPGNMLMDHINGDRTDNRIANLRKCTPSQSLCNRSNFSNRTNTYKGVYADRRQNPCTFYFQITKGDKALARHGFKTAEAARNARNAALASIHGEFANPS